MSDEDLTARFSLALDTESPTPAVYTELIGDAAGLWAWLRTLDPTLPEAPPALPPDTLGKSQPTVRANASIVRDEHGVVTFRVSVALAPAAVARGAEMIPALRAFATLARGMGGGESAPSPLLVAIAQCEATDPESGARCDLDPGHEGEHVWEPDESRGREAP